MSNETTLAFQDQGAVAHCFGCGPDNQQGLQLKSFWNGDDAVATFIPKPHHCGGTPDITYGGLIAALIDCHTCNLAIAHLYKLEQRPIGSDPKINCLTAQLNVSLLNPTPIDRPIRLTARIRSVEGRKIWVDCDVSVADTITARGQVLAIKMRDNPAPS